MLSQKHIILTQSHADDFVTNHSSENDKRMLLSAVDMTTKTTTSKYLQSIIDLDKLWDMFKAVDAIAQQDIRNIYFIRMEDTNFVKVGYSMNIHTRLSNLQVGSGIKLTLEFSFVTQMYRQNEKQLKAYMIAHHERGEWYRLKPGTDYFALIRFAELS